MNNQQQQQPQMNVGGYYPNMQMNMPTNAQPNQYNNNMMQMQFQPTMGGGANMQQQQPSMGYPNMMMNIPQMTSQPQQQVGMMSNNMIGQQQGELRLFLGKPANYGVKGPGCDVCGMRMQMKFRDFGATMFFHCCEKNECKDDWDMCLTCYFFSGIKHKHPLRLYSGEACTGWRPRGYEYARKVHCKQCRTECSTVGFFHKYGSEGEDMCEDCFKVFVSQGNVKFPWWQRYKSKIYPQITVKKPHKKKEENEISVKRGEKCGFVKWSNQKKRRYVVSLKTKKFGWVPAKCFV